MSEISCGIVRDLLPSYTDGISSDETNALIEEHVASCEDCRAALESMRAEAESVGQAENREIDYLRKNRKRNRRIVVSSILAACLAILLFVFLKLFVIGEYSNGDNIAIDVNLDGRLVEVTASVTDSARVIKRFEFDEKDGVVTVRARTVLAMFYSGDPAYSKYEAGEDVKKVVFGNASYLNTVKEELFSSALKNDIIANWIEWNKKDELSRMLSSQMPGHLSKLFWTWESACDFLGFEPFNPLENCSWLEKMNYTGAGISTDNNGERHHAYMYYAGDEQVNVQYLSFETGYRVNLPYYSAASTTDFNAEPIGVPVEFIQLDDVSFIIGGDPNSIRVVWKVEPLVRADGELDGLALNRDREDGRRLVLSNDQVILIRRTNGEKYESADILFDLDGIHYTVRVTAESGNSYMLDSVTERLTDEIKKGIDERQ